MMKIRKVTLLAMMAIFALSIHATNGIPLLKKAEKVFVDGIHYQLDAKNQKAKVIAGTNLYTGDIVIPEKFENDSIVYYVEEIAADAFKNCPTLLSVSIPTTVTKIGSGAFEK